MPLKTVITIEVDSSEFDAFLAKFEKFRAAATAMPKLWVQANEEARKQNALIGKLYVGAQDEAKAARAIGAAFGGGAQALERMGVAGGRARRSISALSATARGLFNNLEKAGGSLLRISSLASAGIAAGSGLLGLGAMWGLDRMGASYGNALRGAQGRGATVPGSAAFATSFGRLVDPNSFLAATNTALTDVTRRVWLYNIGLSDAQLRGRSTDQVAAMAMPDIWKVLHRYPREQLQNVVRAFRLPISAEESTRIYDRPYQDIVNELQAYTRYRRQFNVSDQDLQRWQDFQYQLKAASNTLWAKFGAALSQVAPQLIGLSGELTKLAADFVKSETFKKWVNDATDGLKRLDKWLTGPTFQKDLKGFGDDIKYYSNEFKDGFKDITSTLYGVSGQMKAYTPSDRGAIEGAAAGAAIGGALGGAKGAIVGGVLGFIYGYSANSTKGWTGDTWDPKANGGKGWWKPSQGGGKGASERPAWWPGAPWVGNAVSQAGKSAASWYERGAQWAGDAVSQVDKSAAYITGQISDLGLTKAQTAGVLSTLYGESHLDPSARNPGGSATGIAQWIGSRLRGLEQWSSSHGMNWHTLAAQVGFLKHELGTRYSKVLGAMHQFPGMTAAQASELFLRGYEGVTPSNARVASGGRQDWAAVLREHQATADRFLHHLDQPNKKAAVLPPGHTAPVPANGRTATHKLTPGGAISLHIYNQTGSSAVIGAAQAVP